MAAAMKETARENSDRVDMDESINFQEYEIVYKDEESFDKTVTSIQKLIDEKYYKDQLNEDYLAKLNFREVFI
jgi:hypothetical protein